MMRDKTFVRRALVAVFSIAIASCTSRDLTRTNAAALLAASNRFSPVSAAQLTATGFSNGEAQGFWNASGELSQKGQTHFAGVTFAQLQPKASLKRTVTEVTGIADAQSALGAQAGALKEVQFLWAYEGADQVTRRFIVRGGSGVAVARLFDDGWRLQDLQLQDFRDGFALTQAEQTAAEQDQRAETGRKLALQKLIAESRQSTKEIMKCGPIEDFSGYLKEFFVLTDAGVTGAHRARIDFADVQYLHKVDTQYPSSTLPGMWISDKPWNPGGTPSIRFNSYTSQDALNRDTCYDAVVAAYEKWRSRFASLAKLPNMQ